MLGLVLSGQSDAPAGQRACHTAGKLSETVTRRPPSTTALAGVAGQLRWILRQDRNGEKIGKLQDVYVDVETDQPQFATVKEGLIGRHPTFVPLATGTIPAARHAPARPEDPKTTVAAPASTVAAKLSDPNVNMNDGEV